MAITRWHGLGAGIMMAGLAISPAALAERWIPISTGSDETRYFLDLDSIEQRDRFVFFWVETVTYTEADLPQFESRSQIAADCVNRVWRFQQRYEVEDGEVVVVHQLGEEGPVQVIPPRSPRAEVLAFICREPEQRETTLALELTAAAPSVRLMEPEPIYSCADFGDRAQAQAALNLNVTADSDLPPAGSERACVTLVEW